jgi:hypothetical protein
MQKGKHREIGKRRPPHQQTGTLSAHFIHTLPSVILEDPKEKGKVELRFLAFLLSLKEEIR